MNILITYAMAKAIKQKKKSKGNPNNYPKSKFESNNFNFENIDLNKEYNFYWSNIFRENLTKSNMYKEVTFYLN